MKSIPSILLLLICLPLCGQEIYYSPFTHNFNSGVVETIDREIIIGDQQIVIKSKTTDGFDIQSSTIQEVTNEEFSNMFTSKVYRCTSKDEKFRFFLIVPLIDTVETIDVFIPNQEYHSPQHLRFYVDKLKNGKPPSLPLKLH